MAESKCGNNTFELTEWIPFNSKARIILFNVTHAELLFALWINMMLGCSKRYSIGVRYSGNKKYI
jgi:hypothetical protein